MRTFIIMLIFAITLYAKPIEDNRKILYTNLISATSIITWGFLNWDYGQRSMHTAHEGWFGRDTKYLGSDKLGHFYTTFALSHYFANLYQGFGYDEEVAIKEGAISSFFVNTIMEIGDSFSDYGFSYEDFTMNILGSYLGYYLLMHPDINRVVDIRLEYKPSDRITSGDSYDILTDYDGMKFLTAVKFDGFESLKDTFLKYFEFHLGYYTKEEHGKRERYPYAAIGINLSRLLNPVTPKISRFFNYYQMPYSYIDISK